MFSVTRAKAIAVVDRGQLINLANNKEVYTKNIIFGVL